MTEPRFMLSLLSKSKKFLFLLFLALGVLSCTNRPQGIQVQSSETEQEGTVILGKPILLEESQYIMIPVGFQQPSGFSFAPSSSYYNPNEFYPGTKAYSGAYYETYSGRGINIVFHDKSTDRSHLLLTEKAIITSFFFPARQLDETQQPLPFLLFAITTVDTNSDQVLNEQDESVAYLSDFSGKRLIQITPNQTQFKDWEFDRAQKILYVRVLKDSNGDRAFSDQDKTVILKISLDQPDIGTEIAGDPLQQQLETIIFD